MDSIKTLYDVVKQRKDSKQEGSYTCYLFEQGLDKILKKCGEECSEMIIAAKNNDNNELSNEMCDLIYHMMVLMIEQGVTLEQIDQILTERGQKIGNLKKFHKVDRLS